MPNRDAGGARLETSTDPRAATRRAGPSFLGGAWFIARHDIRMMLRQKETLLWTFVMPPVFFFFIGTITGGFGGGAETADPLVLVAPPEAGFLAAHIERRLEEQDFAVERVAAATAATTTTIPSVTAGASPTASTRRLTLPAGFTDSLLAGRRVRVEYATAEDDALDGEYEEIRVGRAVYTVLADLVVAGSTGSPATPEALSRLAAMPRAVTLEVTQAGRRREPPVGYEQTIPGTMVMFTLLVLFTSGSVLLVIERAHGLLRRLASSPLSRGSIVLGKWGGRMSLGLVQIGFGMALGTFVFGMRWGPDLPMVAALLLAWGALAAVLSLLLGNLARTEGQAVALGVLASNVLAALGGCWWPIEVTPGWMQRLALFLPTGWAMDALHALVSFEAGASSAAPHLLAMLGTALVAGWLAARTFRFQ